LNGRDRGKKKVKRENIKSKVPTSNNPCPTNESQNRGENKNELVNVKLPKGVRSAIIKTRGLAIIDKATRTPRERKGKKRERKRS